MTRREWLAMAPAAAAGERERPRVLAVQSGDVSTERAVVWARSSRTARLEVELALNEEFSGRRWRRVGPVAGPETDHTARVEIAGLPAGAEVHYRAAFVSPGSRSEPAAGRFRTPPAAGKGVRFLWSGDTAGQGWGINPEWGGMRGYETMRRREPDFFLHSGDVIYADNPVLPEVKLPDGTMWRNVTTPEKSKVAATLDEFRGNYRYNLLDRNVLRFSAEVAQLWQWDDHEVENNWSPARPAAMRKLPFARQAFLEYAPMRLSRGEAGRIYRKIAYGPLLDVFLLDLRSYRGPNTHNRQEREGPETAYLGAAQREWLRRELAASRAVWKVIAADMPIGLVVGDGKDPEGRPRFENCANGPGGPLGRELEIAALLRFVKERRIRNTVWLTADVHYTAAHHYDPARARFRDFDPFWEFVSGPLHAGTFGPNATDETFGIEVVFQQAPPPGQSNLPPSAGMQYFGEVEIDWRSASMTVTLRNIAGEGLFVKTLEAGR